MILGLIKEVNVLQVILPICRALSSRSAKHTCAEFAILKLSLNVGCSTVVAQLPNLVRKTMFRSRVTDLVSILRPRVGIESFRAHKGEAIHTYRLFNDDHMLIKKANVLQMILPICRALSSRSAEHICAEFAILKLFPNVGCSTVIAHLSNLVRKRVFD